VFAVHPTDTNTEGIPMKVRTALTALAVALTLFTTAPAHACDVPTAGDRALLFGVAPNLTLSMIEGTTIAWRTHRSDRVAWRFGVSLGASWRSQDREFGGVYTEDRTDLGVDLTAYRVRYLTTGDQARLYHGYGPFVGYDRERSEQAANDVTDKYEQDDITLGLANIIGVEWFRWENVSLFAEYGATLGYTSSTEKDIDGSSSQTREITSTNVALASNGVRFGLAARF